MARAMTMTMAKETRLLAFGEILLRFSPPGRELLLQSPRLDVWVGGAEANVVTQLACLGHRVGIASRLPDDDLGRAAMRMLRGHGVNTRRILSGGERMGIYYATAGAGLRAGEVLYDRAGSAFAEAADGDWNWDAMLADVERLHLSGITPALGAAPARSAIAAAEAAAARGIAVSFDGNWRGKLWARWDGDPRALLTPIVAQADILFGNDRDVALLLGRDAFPGTARERLAAAADAAFGAFPKLRLIAGTRRSAEDADTNRLGTVLVTRDEQVETGELPVTGIVDRIGSGDAFVAGVLHAVLNGRSLSEAAEIGLALGVLKHSLPGDASMFRQADIDAFRAGGRDVRR